MVSLLFPLTLLLKLVVGEEVNPFAFENGRGRGDNMRFYFI
jgi:hypothetical protein